MKIISDKEEHPWKRFPKKNNKAHSLILGSFPPIKFTKNRSDKTKCDVDFFYGSKDNSFWDLFFKIKRPKMKWPDDKNKLILWLKNNHWVISDIVLKANRKKDTAADSDLINIDWNTEIIDEILIGNPIDKIFFTSRFVEINFFKLIFPKLKNKISKNKIEFITLISPSPNGLRRADWSYKLTSIPKQKNESLTEFRLRYYEEKFNK